MNAKNPLAVELPAPGESKQARWRREHREEYNAYQRARKAKKRDAAHAAVTMPGVPISGYPGYSVTDSGEVWSLKRIKLRRLTPQPNNRGEYAYVVLVRDGVKHRRPVHQIVCEVFNGPRPSLEHLVRHLDGDDMNNRASNLCWGTSLENAADTDRLGRQARGDTHGCSKLNSDQVREIRALRSLGLSSPKVAARFGISDSHVRGIWKGEAWRDLA